MEDGFGLFLVIALFPILLWMGQKALAIILLFTFPMFLSGVYKRFLSRLEIDDESINCLEKGVEISLKWRDVISLQYLQQHIKPKKTLVFGTAEGFAAIVIDHFDHQKIWELIQLFAPSVALEKEAHRNVPAYQEWESQTRKSIAGQNLPLQVSDHWSVKVAGWGTMILATALLYGLWEPGKKSIWFGIAFFLVFFSLGLFAVLTTGKLQIDKESIVRVTPLGKYQIQWEEITHIEQDVYGALIFYGLDKYLAIYGPGWWSGKNKLAGAEFLFAEIELRKMEIRHIRVSLKMSKNTKVQ